MSSNRHIHCVLGFERTGSTLLHDTLLQVTDSVGVGESRHIYKRALRPDRDRCGCGELFSQCPFWNKVEDRLSVCGYDAKKIIINDSSWRVLYNWAKYKAYTVTLFNALFEVSEKNSVIDSSKSIFLMLMLKKSGFFNLKIYHTRKHPHEVFASLLKRDGEKKKYSGWAGHSLLLLKHEMTIFTIDMLSLFYPIHNMTINDLAKLSMQPLQNTGINHSCGGSPSKLKGANRPPMIKTTEKYLKAPLWVRALTVYSTWSFSSCKPIK